MNWFKRISLFIIINLLVVITLSTLLSLLGVRPYLTAYGIDYQSLAVFCLIWGFSGAFISLALSRVMAKWMMGVRIIDPHTADPAKQSLVQAVHTLARSAGLSAMPEVGVYESPEVNAFATGPTKNRSLVAVSSGLLARLRRDEIDGVLGHEVAHIANGDMVTMTLLQGVINAFVMFLARAISYAISQVLRSRDEEESASPLASYAITWILEIVFMILGSIVIAWFSRWREFRADRGGADLAGRQKMIGALDALRRTSELVDKSAQPAAQLLKINGRPSALLRLFASHPPLETRIERLQALV